jgi:outer membrane protein assembly factor BamB
MNNPTPHFSAAPQAADTDTHFSAGNPVRVAAAPSLKIRPRVWPGLVIVGLVWLAITVPGWVAPATMVQFMAMLWGPIVGTLAIVGWWVFASRIPWLDRGLGVIGCVATGAVAYMAFHPSFNFFGVIIYALPVVLAAWVFWLALTPFLPWPVRRIGLLVVFALAWGYFALVRFDGIDGSMRGEVAYRWTPTAEQRFLAERAERNVDNVSPVLAGTPLELQPGDWPGFRGPNRDGRLTGVSIDAAWEKNLPRLVWKHRVGPGWGSFAVVGTHLYTQEQRGDNEAVVCYHTDTGAEIWSHEDESRFSEIVAGPGPRATPTFHAGKIYTLGGAGTLNCLDAATGKALWKRDIVADSGAKVPQWGFAASPLVVQDVVTVFAGGPDGKCVMAYDAATGAPKWSAGDGKLSYCSLQPARLGGVDQVLLATDRGLTAFEPVKGDVLWQHEWDSSGVARVVQPALLDGTDILVGTGMGVGTRRLHLGHDKDSWTPKEVWTTRAIKPYFNDLVVHRGHLYGFDGEFFTCVELAKGKTKWKERGYGSGQVLLLADQGMLLIVSEKGEVALIDAVPDEHREHGRFQAIAGKTWNHPVIAHGKLFVRNGQEAACYALEVEPWQ